MPYRDVFTNGAPLAMWVFQSLDYLFGSSRLPHFIVSLFLTVHQAWLFNKILLVNKALGENSYVPAFLYALLMHLSFDFLMLTPVLMSNTFILLSLQNVMKRVERKTTDDMFLMNGVYLAIAALLYPPSTLYLVIFILCLIQFTSAIPRRMLLMAFGFFSVICFMMLGFSFFEATLSFFDQFVVASFKLPSIWFVSFDGLLWIVLPIMIITLLVSVNFNLRVNFANYQNTFQQIFVYLMITSILTIFISKEIYLAQLILLIGPLAFFLSHYFLSSKKKFWPAIVQFAIWTCVCSSYSLSMNWIGLFNGNEISKSIVRERELNSLNESAVVLTDSLEPYIQYNLSTAYFDWRLSKHHLDNPSDPTKLIRVYQEFLTQKPELIFDPNGTFDPFIEKIPVLQQIYRKTDVGYELISKESY